jgi:heat shock protein HtpX
MLSSQSFGTIRTTALLALLTGLLVAIGRAVGRPGGTVSALGFALAMNLGTYWFSDKIALKMFSTRPPTAERATRLKALAVPNRAVVGAD